MFQCPFNKHIYMFAQILCRSLGHRIWSDTTQIRTMLKEPTSKHKLIRDRQFPLFWPIPHEPIANTPNHTSSSFGCLVCGICTDIVPALTVRQPSPHKIITIMNWSRFARCQQVVCSFCDRIKDNDEEKSNLVCVYSSYRTDLIRFAARVFIQLNKLDGLTNTD